MASDGGIVDNEDDDADLRQAIALSLQEVNGLTAEDPIALDEEGTPNPVSAPPVSNGMGFLGLNRKQMEEERLSRKRKASSSPQPGPKLSKVPLANDAKRKASSSPQPGPKTSNATFSNAAKRGKSGNDPKFRHGVVKKTWVLGSPLGSDVIKLEDVLESDDLQLAVLSSFQWDIPWLFPKMNISETPITLIMQAKDDATKEQYRRETAYIPKLRLCFPSMEGQINCMHSKLMLLSHANYLRIVIPTANLVSYDWGETGTMENMCFIIDLSRLPDAKKADELTFFGEELVYFLNAQGLEKSIVNSLYKFDFSETKNLAFIHTMGGAHVGSTEPWRRTGFCGLGRSVERLGLRTSQEINADFVTSSVGSLNLDFLSSLYLACQGDTGETIYEAKSGGKSKEAQLAKVKQDQAKELLVKHFRIYFPTHDTVRSSIARSAGTICFQSKWYNSPTFPKSLMRDCQSKRPRVLMHNKAIYVTNATRPWAYVGSANCSESAWGALSKDRSLKMPKLNCRNWECGVLIPTTQGDDTKDPEAENYMAKGITSSSSAENIFQGIVPLPMVYPGAEHGSKKPWYYSEN